MGCGLVWWCGLKGALLGVLEFSNTLFEPINIFPHDLPVLIHTSAIRWYGIVGCILRHLYTEAFNEFHLFREVRHAVALPDPILVFMNRYPTVIHGIPVTTPVVDGEKPSLVYPFGVLYDVRHHTGLTHSGFLVGDLGLWNEHALYIQRYIPIGVHDTGIGTYTGAAAVGGPDTVVIGGCV